MNHRRRSLLELDHAQCKCARAGKSKATSLFQQQQTAAQYRLPDAPTRSSAWGASAALSGYPGDGVSPYHVEPFEVTSASSIAPRASAPRGLLTAAQSWTGRKLRTKSTSYTASHYSTPAAPLADSSSFNDVEFDDDIRSIAAQAGQPMPAPTMATPPAAAQPSPAPQIALQPVAEPYAIFDQVGRSMQYANTFNLGSIELDRRFNAFERELDQAEANRAAAQAAKLSHPMELDDIDLVSELALINDAAPPALTMATTRPMALHRLSDISAFYIAPNEDDAWQPVWVLQQNWENAELSQRTREQSFQATLDYLDMLHERNQRVWDEAVENLFTTYFYEPQLEENWGLPPRTRNFFRWILEEGRSVSLVSRLIQLLMTKINPQQSNKYSAYIEMIKPSISQAGVLDDFHRADPERLRRTLVGLTHWLWLDRDIIARVARSGARYHMREIAEAVRRNDQPAIDAHAERLGELIGMAKLAYQQQDLSNNFLETVFGFMLKEAAEVILDFLPGGKAMKKVAGVVTELAESYLTTDRPKGPSKADRFEQELMLLFRELYWSIVDPEMNVHSIENGQLKFHEGMDRFKTLRDKSGPILDSLQANIQQGSDPDRLLRL